MWANFLNHFGMTKKDYKRFFIGELLIHFIFIGILLYQSYGIHPLPLSLIIILAVIAINFFFYPIVKYKVHECIYHHIRKEQRLSFRIDCTLISYLFLQPFSLLIVLLLFLYSFCKKWRASATKSSLRK